MVIHRYVTVIIDSVEPCCVDIADGASMTNGRRSEAWRQSVLTVPRLTFGTDKSPTLTRPTGLRTSSYRQGVHIASTLPPGALKKALHEVKSRPMRFRNARHLRLASPETVDHGSITFGVLDTGA